MTIENARPSLPGAFRLFCEACSFYAAHWKIFLGISLIPVVFALPPFFIKEEQGALLLTVSILSILVDLISRLVFFRAVTENGEPEEGLQGAFKKGLGFFFPFIWVSILSGFATLGGFVLLIIPGLMLSIWLSTSTYVLFAENRRGLLALTGSWHYVKGYWWAVFGRLFFLMILLMLAGIILGFLTAGTDILTALKSGGQAAPQASFLGQIINIIWNNLLFIPLSLIYSYLIYRSLKKVKPKGPSEAEEAKLKRGIISFAVMGLIGLIVFAFFSASILFKFLKNEGIPFPPNLIETPGTPAV